MVINLEVPLDKAGHYAVHVERTFVIADDRRRADHARRIGVARSCRGR